MIYLEYDDGHNNPIIYDYADREDAIRCILGERPTQARSLRADGKFFYVGKEETAAESLLRDQTEWDQEMAELETLLCDEDDDRAEWSASIHCDEYRRVDAKEMERRAEHAKMTAVAMRKGIKTP